MITKANNDSQAQREPDYIRYDCGGCGFETMGGWRNNDVCPKCNHKPMGRTELYITPPAPVALTDEQIDAVLDSSGNIAYVIADKRERLRMFARDILRVSLQSVSGYPETLPCPVLLEPGMRFGKGIRTQTMLEALQRRADYYARLDAMTPEEQAELDARIAEFESMLPQPVSVVSGESISQPLTDALRDVIAERQRQISVKGWTPEHDDTYIGCELAAAAISYIEPVEAENYWPADWHDGSFRPSDYRRNLVKATALLVAELERLDRISAESVLSEVSDGDVGDRQ